MARHGHDVETGRRGILAAVVIALLLAGGAAVALWPGGPFAGATSGPDDVATSSPTGAPTPRPTPTPTPTPTPEPDAVFTIVATGDVLTHAPVNSSARTADGYDFGPLLEPVRAWVQGADLALCHLEVPVAPAGTAPSGYPLFGSPAQIVSSLAAEGWDGCSTASNHSVDRGMAGLTTTLDALDAAGLGHVGTARSAEEAAQAQVYELRSGRQSVRVAQLAATYGTNGMPVPADAPWAVSLIDTARIVEEARAARSAGADIVVASIHCCVEYVFQPTEMQQQIAAELAASGEIDLLIGHHAHVPQPVTRLGGGPRGEGMWVAYGLGNFISNQDAECCVAGAETGLLLTATIIKPPDGTAAVTLAEWTGLTVDRFGGHRVFALPEITGGAGRLSAEQVAARQARLDALVVDAPQRTTPPTPAAPPVPAGPTTVVVPRTVAAPPAP